MIARTCRGREKSSIQCLDAAFFAHHFSVVPKENRLRRCSNEPGLNARKLPPLIFRDSQCHAHDSGTLAVSSAFLHSERGGFDRETRADEVERVSADDAADPGEGTGQQASRRVDGAVG